MLSIGNVKTTLQKNLTWLEDSEAEMGNIMHDMVSQRYLRELSAINHLVEKIERCIEDAQPVVQLWLVAPDTHAIDPSTVWAQYEQHLPEYMRTKPPVAQPATEAAEGNSATAVSPTGKLRAYRVQISASNKQLLDKVKNLKVSGMLDKFVPEKSEHAENLEPAMPSPTKMQKVPVTTAKATNHLRRNSVTSIRPIPESNSADEQFRREMAVFHAKRLQFEEQILKKRAAREKEFRSMGMSASTAKLAAYNEMLLDEQQDMEDFDTKNKPKRRPVSNRRASNFNRRPSSAVVKPDAGRRPTSANAALH